MTECSTKQLTFSYFKKRKLSVDFEGGEITSDAGLLLIRQADDRMGLVKGLANCIRDIRDARYVDHDMETLSRQYLSKQAG